MRAWRRAVELLLSGPAQEANQLSIRVPLATGAGIDVEARGKEEDWIDNTLRTCKRRAPRIANERLCGFGHKAYIDSNNRFAARHYANLASLPRVRICSRGRGPMPT